MELQLTEGDLVEWLVEPELRADRQIELGDVLSIENIATKCCGWIGDAPFALDAERTAAKLNASSDDWHRAVRPEFADRFVLTTFGVQSLGGIVHPTGLGLELLFRDDQRRLNQGQRIHIHTVFPAARFEVTGTSRTNLGHQLKTEFSAAAELVPPGQLVALTSSLSNIGVSADLHGSASQRISVNHDRQVTWSSTTHAAIVEAIGEGDTRALWVFHRPYGPLAGKTFETVTGLTVSRRRTTLEFDARMFVIFNIGPYPIRRYSKWVRLATEWGD